MSVTHLDPVSLLLASALTREWAAVVDAFAPAPRHPSADDVGSAQLGQAMGAFMGAWRDTADQAATALRDAAAFLGQTAADGMALDTLLAAAS